MQGGCASQKSLAQYQNEVRDLREERTLLKRENRELRAQNESYQVSLAEASIKPSAPVSVADNPELGALGIDYTTRGGNPVISIPSDIVFASGKSELTKKGQEALRTVARVLLDDHFRGHFWIEGHTDTDPIKRSKWESHRDLSVERAMAVLQYLVEECDVPDYQCVVAGHGPYQPLTANDDNAGKARNRRIEIVVHRSGPTDTGVYMRAAAAMGAIEDLPTSPQGRPLDQPGVLQVARLEAASRQGPELSGKTIRFFSSREGVGSIVLNLDAKALEYSASNGEKSTSGSLDLSKVFIADRWTPFIPRSLDVSPNREILIVGNVPDSDEGAVFETRLLSPQGTEAWGMPALALAFASRDIINPWGIVRTPGLDVADYAFLAGVPQTIYFYSKKNEHLQSADLGKHEEGLRDATDLRVLRPDAEGNFRLLAVKCRDLSDQYPVPIAVCTVSPSNEFIRVTLSSMQDH
jgi:chemotaxis protein MotB